MVPAGRRRPGSTEGRTHSNFILLFRLSCLFGEAKAAQAGDFRCLCFSLLLTSLKELQV
jgi:hypothetical protein